MINVFVITTTSSPQGGGGGAVPSFPSKDVQIQGRGVVPQKPPLILAWRVLHRLPVRDRSSKHGKPGGRWAGVARRRPNVRPASHDGSIADFSTHYPRNGQITPVFVGVPVGQIRRRVSPVTSFYPIYVSARRGQSNRHRQMWRQIIQSGLTAYLITLLIWVHTVCVLPASQKGQSLPFTLVAGRSNGCFLYGSAALPWFLVYWTSCQCLYNHLPHQVKRERHYKVYTRTSA